MAYSIQVPASSVFSAQAAAAAPARLLRGAVETLLAWQHRAAERQQLAALSDYDLKDVGLTRSDAIAEAEKPFWRG